MIAGGAVAAALKAKKKKEKALEMQELNEDGSSKQSYADPTKFAGAQLEQKTSGGLREKPKLKIQSSNGEEYIDANDSDIDVLTDAVHGALVSYYKRKNGYCQCCKYLVFLVRSRLVLLVRNGFSCPQWFFLSAVLGWTTCCHDVHLV